MLFYYGLAPAVIYNIITASLSPRSMQGTDTQEADVLKETVKSRLSCSRDGDHVSDGAQNGTGGLYLMKTAVTKNVNMRPRQAKTTAAIGSGSPQRRYSTGIGSQPDGAGTATSLKRRCTLSGILCTHSSRSPSFRCHYSV